MVNSNESAPPRALSQISVDFQKLLDNGFKFPQIFTSPPGETQVSLAELFADREHKVWLDQQLMQSGAILFRGCGFRSAKDVDSLLESLAYEEFPYTAGGGIATRRHVHGRVITANEYPLDKYIGFHNEAAYFEKSPTRIFFFCERAPPAGSGGATPIVPGHAVYRRVAENRKLAGELLNKGPVFMTSILPEESWKAKFGTQDENVAQSRAEREQQSNVTWLGDGRMKVSTGALSELFKPDRAGRMSAFTSLGFIVSLNQQGFQMKKSYLEFGDGERVSDETMEEVVKIMCEEQVVFPWEEGDLLVLDNTAVLHSRQPCTSSNRTILVGLTF